MNKNISECVKRIIRIKRYSLEIEQFNEELVLHPDQRSLLGISDVFRTFNIHNDAYYVDSNNLEEVPLPFLAHTILHNNEFVVVEAVTPTGIVITNDLLDKKRLIREEFKKIYRGSVLVFEDKEPVQAGGINLIMPSAQNIAYGLCALIITGLILSIGNYTFFSSWRNILLLSAKSAGVIISILLLIQSIDKNNPLLQKICKSGSKTDCSAILSSNAAQAFWGLSWSEIGFFYFTGTWLALLFNGNFPAMRAILAALTIIALPYTFFSIYYQARIAKKWCLLCCSVQAILWIEFFAQYPDADFGTFPDIAQLVKVLLISAIPVPVWMLLKPVIQAKQQLVPLKYQLNKMKYNIEVFHLMLSNQPKYSRPKENWSITLGNKNAGKVITMVTDPYCIPCSKAHNMLHDWLNERDDLQLQIVFTASNEEDDIQTPVSRHFMALHQQNNPKLLQDAMHDWYNLTRKDYQSWAKRYPVEMSNLIYEQIDQQKEWCKMAEVTATPTILINGYRLPKIYLLKEIKYMLN